MNTDSNATERAVRQMYRTDLTSFIGLAHRLTQPQARFVPHWSIELIGEALRRCCRGDTERLILNLPPRYLKSFCASVALPAWALAQRPQAKIMCIAGSRGAAEDHHRLAWRLMSHPSYRALFPHLKGCREQRDAIRLPHGGQRSAHVLSPGSGVTGRGADLIVLDDPLPASYAEDRTRREQVNRWYDHNVYQRLNEKARGAVVVVMQRLHANDLTGHLLRQGGWELLSLSAVATEDEHPAQFGLPGDRPLRRKGEALNPAFETREDLKAAMRRMGAATFMAQYQQRPYPPGADGGSRGAWHWLEPIGPEMPGVGLPRVAFVRQSPEDAVEAELFAADAAPPPTPPALRRATAEEWLTYHRTLRPHRLAGHSPSTPSA